MFRLIKLAVYLTIGYFLYEFVLGIMDRPASAPVAGKPAALPAAASSPGVNLTGASHEGAVVPVQDGAGGTRRQKVGRGVIS